MLKSGWLNERKTKKDTLFVKNKEITMSKADNKKLKSHSLCPVATSFFWDNQKFCL